MNRHGMSIGAQESGSAADEWIDVENPATKTILAQVPRARAADVDRAVAAAAQTQRAWARTSAAERAAALDEIGRRLAPVAQTHGRLLSSENGNALRTQSRGEAAAVPDILRYFAGAARQIHGRSQQIRSDSLDYTRREPFGVVGAIVPWNSPTVLSAFKIAPAIASGNTVVLKASEVAPLAVLELVRICAEVLPPGVVNVLTGYGHECGVDLVEHPLVRKISFTGSTAVGRDILRRAGDRIVPVTLELGGKGAQIVFPDVDVAAAARGVIAGTRVTRQGQSCSSGSRIYVHRTIFDDFAAEFAEQLRALRVGDPLDEATDIGALSNQAQFAKVTGHIDGALARGTELLTGGLPPQDGPLAQGWFCEPTVFVSPDPASPLVREEIFGPVFSVAPWDDEADVVARVNDTDYGLSAFLWGNNLAQVVRVAHAVEVGYVWVNQAGPQAPGHSYGGFKRSGIGREMSLEAMLDSYTQEKQITIALPA